MSETNSNPSEQTALPQQKTRAESPSESPNAETPRAIHDANNGKALRSPSRHRDAKLVCYRQDDARWGDKPYGERDPMRIVGCGPTSLAMAVSTFTDKQVAPDEMADWAYRNGYRCEGSGSYHSLIPEGAQHFGLEAEGAAACEGQKIADALAAGKLVIALMGPGHFTATGHFIVLHGVTKDGKILVADPGSVENSGHAWDLRTLLDEARQGSGAGGPFWIISKP